MKIEIVKTETTPFEVHEDKYKSFQFNDIMFLSGKEYQPVSNSTPRYVVFKTREEFLENVNMYDVDTTKEVLINNKGNFLCPLKASVTITESKEVINESTDTEENKAE